MFPAGFYAIMRKGRGCLRDLEIPYEVRGDKSKIILEYRENTSLQDSEFDALLDLGFDPSLCLGYPTMHAWVENDLKV